MDMKQIVNKNLAKKLWLTGDAQQLASACVQKLYQKPWSTPVQRKCEASPRPENVAPLRRVCNLERAHRAEMMKRNAEKMSFRPNKPKSRSSTKGMFRSLFAKKSGGVNLAKDQRMVKLPTVKLYKGRSGNSDVSSQRRHERRTLRKDVFMTGLGTSILNVADFVRQPVRNQHMQVKGHNWSNMSQSNIQCDLLPIDHQTKNMIALNRKPSQKQPQLQQTDKGREKRSWEHPPPPELFDMNHDEQFSSVHEEIESQYRKLKRVNELKQFENLRRVAHLGSGLNGVGVRTDFVGGFKGAKGAKLERIVQFIKDSHSVVPDQRSASNKTSTLRLTTKPKATAAGRAPTVASPAYATSNNTTMAAKRSKTGMIMGRGKKPSSTSSNTSLRRGVDKSLPKRSGIELQDSADGVLTTPTKSTTKLGGGYIFKPSAKQSATTLNAANSKTKINAGNIFKSSAQPLLKPVVKTKSKTNVATNNVFKPPAAHMTTIFEWKDPVFGKTGNTAIGKKTAKAGNTTEPKKDATEPKYKTVHSVGKIAKNKAPSKVSMKPKRDHTRLGNASAKEQPINLKAATEGIQAQYAKPHQPIPTASSIACASVPEPSNSRFAHYTLMRDKVYP